MQPLVLAIEPDLRQAAIVKRIVREKVLADVTVVDSRDAALEAMRTTVPDVLLLSALLSPRDEDELIAHLRTRRDAEHLQTHTIPQLASTMAEAKPSKGLLKTLLRRKDAASTPSGCDPDLFAEEIRTYLARASQKKSEVRDPSIEPVTSLIAPVAKPAEPEPSVVADAPESSWASPFEWRPTRSTTATRAPEPEPAVEAAAAIAVEETPAFEPLTTDAGLEQPPAFEPIIEPVAVEPVFVESAVVEPLIAAPVFAESVVAEPLVVEPVFAESVFVEPPVVQSPVFESPVLDSPAPVADVPTMVIAPRPAVRSPLTLRTLKGWWFVEGKEDTAKTPDSDLRGMLSSLAVPLKIAAVTYADGCRVRRVRLMEA